MGQLTVAHPAAVKLWGNLLSKSAYQYSFWFKSGLLKPGGEDDDGAVVVKMEQLMELGYTVEFDLEGPCLMIPTPGDLPLPGNEGRLSIYTDSLSINQDRVAIIDDGKFADGLVPFSFRDRVQERFARQQFPIQFDERIMVKGSGALGDTTWMTLDTTQPTASARDKRGSPASDANDLRAPSSTAGSRVITGTGTNWAGMATTDTLSLDLVDKALLQAIRPNNNTTNRRLVPPVLINGSPALALIGDYVGLINMNAATAQRFYDIERAKLQGGLADSQLMKVSAFIYRSPIGIDVYFIPHPNSVKFTATTTGTGVRTIRALVMGQSAIREAYGRDSVDMPEFSWHEETGNLGNQLTVAAGSTYGLQKTAYNTTETGTTTEDWATVSLDYYGNW